MRLIFSNVFTDESCQNNILQQLLHLNNAITVQKDAPTTSLSVIQLKIKFSIPWQEMGEKNEFLLLSRRRLNAIVRLCGPAIKRVTWLLSAFLSLSEGIYGKILSHNNPVWKRDRFQWTWDELADWSRLYKLRYEVSNVHIWIGVAVSRAFGNLERGWWIRCFFFQI